MACDGEVNRRRRLEEETRYDYQSARSMTRAALAGAGLEEGGTLEDADLKKFADSLNGIGDHLDAVWPSLGVAPTGMSLPEPPAAEEAAAEEAPAAEAKADGGAAEEKAPAKKAPAKKAPAKKAAKK